jgi:DNA-binding HxlR family transcriptional regulator
MNDISQFATVIAEALYQRFRLVAMVIDKADSFVGTTPAEGATENLSGTQAFVPWLKSLAENQNELQVIAGDLVIRAFRVALEPTNYTILLKLHKQPAVTFADLMQATQLNRLALNERLNDLIQAGLAGKDMQTGQVQGTQAATALVDFVQATRDNLFNLILQKLPEVART